MKDINFFQATLLGFFFILLIVGVAAVALYQITGEKGEQVGSVIVWGMIPADEFEEGLEALKRSDPMFENVSYVAKDPLSYEDELIEALATGMGPDVFMITQEWVLRHKNKIFIVPYTSVSEDSFRNAFVEAGEVFLSEEGVLAVPFAVDPMVMYWNRDIVTAAGFPQPPRYWDELFAFTEKVTKRTNDLRITRSAVALGEFFNVTHAKEILAALFLQIGNPIIEGNAAASEKGTKTTLNEDPDAESVLRFYTEFSNPSKTVYTWNRSLPSSRDAFLRGDLALYFGFASEREALFDENPNLNFGVVSLPQIRDNPRPTTFGNVFAFAVARTSKNVSGSFLSIWNLATGENGAALASGAKLPPGTRSNLASKPTDAFTPTFFDGALLARTWLDPSATKTDALFGDMINSITTGKSTIDSAISTLAESLIRI